MRRELNDLIRVIVDTRFAVENIAIHAIQNLRQGEPITYRGHEWGREQFEVMEKVHQGVEAAWHYAKWLQFPEMESRLDDGFAALSQSVGAQTEMDKLRLTNSGSVVASLVALERPGQEDGKELEMAKETVASLTDKYADLYDRVEEMAETVDNHVTNLNEQIAALEERIEEIEETGDRRKSRGREMTPEERKAAGERMQMGRATKLGLDSIEQLHALKLRPGQTPTKAEIKKVKEQFPVS